MKTQDYKLYDALGLAALIRNREISEQECLAAAIDAIEAENTAINAVVTPLYDEARKAIEFGLPDGPFRGVPFLLKDLGQLYRGARTTNGSRLFQNHVADHDSTLVARYKAAGLTICGKTNTPEFGLATTTEPVLHGPTRNPWSLTYSPGGSSGGAAAAVAAGFTPVAHASDGGGSIRIPASACGLFGLKPTRARTPSGPDQGEGWNGLSCMHVVSRSVRDSAALLDLTAGAEPGAPYFAPPPLRAYVKEVEQEPEPLRIAFSLRTFTGADLDPEIAAATELAAKRCEELGHHVTHATPAVHPDVFKKAHGNIVVCNIAAMLDNRARVISRDITPQDVEPVTWNNYQAGLEISGAAYAQSVALIHGFTRTLAHFFQDYDVLLTPTMACLPPKIGTLDTMTDNIDYLKLLYQMIGYTALFNDAGHPAMSVPLATSKSGLPIGIQFAAAFGDEGTLFQLAAQLEKAGLFQLPDFASVSGR